MRRSLMILVALMLVPLLVVGAGPAAVTGAQATYCASAAEVDVLQRINAHRAQHGEGPLTLSQPLGVGATMKSRDMAERNYFSHFSPDGRGPTEVLEDAGYPTSNTSYGENIAAGYPDAASVFEAWRNSPSHNSSMLEGSFIAIGISVAYNPNSTYGYYWTTEFGSEVVAAAQPCGGEEPPPDDSDPPPDDVDPPANENDFVSQLIAALKRILNQVLNQ